MCTVTILYTTDGYQLTMNRDEQRNRAAELAPNRVGNAVYPRDGAAGGTWIATTDAGISYCLLNRYDAVEYTPAISRGEIILHILRTDASAVLQPAQLERVAPFTLLRADAENVTIWQWNGLNLTVQNHQPEGYFHLSSSSWHAEETLAYRRHQAEEWWQAGALLDTETNLPLYHLYAPKNKAVWAVRVERPHTHSKSITQLVSQQGRPTILHYWNAQHLPPAN